MVVVMGVSKVRNSDMRYATRNTHQQPLGKKQTDLNLVERGEIDKRIK